MILRVEWQLGVTGMVLVHPGAAPRKHPQGQPDLQTVLRHDYLQSVFMGKAKPGAPHGHIQPSILCEEIPRVT